jgi:hypothetical protein
MEVIIPLQAEAVLYMFGPSVRLLRSSVPCIASRLGKTAKEPCPSTVPRLPSIDFGKGAKIRSSLFSCRRNRSEQIGTASSSLLNYFSTPYSFETLLYGLGRVQIENANKSRGHS